MAFRQNFKAPWFVKNTTIHKDLRQQTSKELIIHETEEIHQQAEIHKNKLLGTAVNYDPVQIGPKFPKLKCR